MFLPFMIKLSRDTRLALVTLLRHPGTTTVSIFILALGIGANTAIFSLLNAVVLRPLPVPHPEQLVALATTSSDNVNGEEAFTLPMFEELTSNQKAFSDLFAWNGGGINNLEANGRHFTASLAVVSGAYYQAMRIAPLLGRFIERSDVSLDSGASKAVAVISYRIWRSWYRGDPNIVGRTVRVEGQPFTIIGVEPESYSGLIIDGSTDVTVPLFAPGQRVERDRRKLWLTLHARLKPGFTLRRARASLQALWPSIQKATIPADYERERLKRFLARRITVESAANGVSFLRKRFTHPLGVLLVLVGAVLLIACLNLATLSLAKITSQQHVAGIKIALGASRSDLILPSLIESLILSSAGALLGLGLAYQTSRMLLHIAWTGLVQTPLSTAPDYRVLAFTATVALIAGVLFSVIPTWFTTRAEIMTVLRLNTRSLHHGPTVLGKILSTTQLAFSLVLVIGAMLFGKTLIRLHTVDAGYQRDHLFTMLLFPQSGRRASPDSVPYYRELAEKVSQLPGVLSVSYSEGAPAIQFEYRRPAYSSPEAPALQAIDEVVGPNFFSTMGMRILNGRDLSWSDDEHSPAVAIISQSLAGRLYGRENPVGRNLYWGPRGYQDKLHVVGVVNSASLWKVESLQPMAVYRPLLQNLEYGGEPLMDVRTAVDPHSIKGAAERAVRSLGRHYSLRTMTVEERLDSYLTVQRLTALLTGFFGAAALLIASIGLYGLLSFQVARRTNELGIQAALGAQRRQLLSLVFREVLIIAGIGCLMGLVASLALRSFVASIVFGVSATDPVVLGIATGTLIIVAIAAGVLPARRAAAIDPMTALRLE